MTPTALIFIALLGTGATTEDDVTDIELNLILAGRALALVRGREYALPQDLREIAPDVFRHRLMLSYEALADGITPDHVIDRILGAVPVPELALRERMAQGSAPVSSESWNQPAP